MAVKLGAEAVTLHRRVSGNKHPETAWALAHLSLSHFFLADYTAAETATREAISIFQTAYGSDSVLVVENLCKLGNIHQRRGNDDDAIETYREAVSGFGRLQREGVEFDFYPRRDAEAATMRLAILLEARNLEAEAATVVSGFTPQTPNGFLARGQYFAQGGAYDKALSDFIRVLESKPQHSTARRALYDLCDQHNFYGEAIAALDESIAKAADKDELEEVRQHVVQKRSAPDR